MASKFLELSPPVMAARKVGTPIVAIETGFFMRLPYPKNVAALAEKRRSFRNTATMMDARNTLKSRMKLAMFQMLAWDSIVLTRSKPGSAAAGMKEYSGAT